MKHTENYKLNLIETSDPFSPEPLNENTRKVDELFRGQLVFATGVHTGTGGVGAGAPCRIEFPFKPLMVVVSGGGEYGGYPWFRGMWSGLTYSRGSSVYYAALTWEDRAVRWYSTNVTNGNASLQLNEAGGGYSYIAFGVAE